jgi:hypothetical protein
MMAPIPKCTRTTVPATKDVRTSSPGGRVQPQRARLVVSVPVRSWSQLGHRLVTTEHHRPGRINTRQPCDLDRSSSSRTAQHGQSRRAGEFKSPLRHDG